MVAVMGQDPKTFCIVHSGWKGVLYTHMCINRLYNFREFGGYLKCKPFKAAKFG